ncbi:GGDEF domain-containing protein [Salinicola sp. JS01]|uniref:GGDEF domain-containing protein n=1 Tax=Salinicola sp. JS01 TaxID=3050071 RepID=UPI00255BB2B6|nr:GGDEF domain-containing protein [Salinicola sp. JS01]WIX31868.1 GGDEF domain-containing protein [Salinicola sp. JS01]
MAIATLIFGMFAIADYQILGLTRAYYLLVAMRIVVVGLCLFLALIMLLRGDVSHEVWLHAMPLWVLATGIILIVPLRPDSLSTQVMAVIVATIGFYLLIPNLLTVVAFASLYLSLGFLAAAALFADAPPGALLRLALLLIMANGVGFCALLRLEKLQRRQFSLLHDERDQNRQLLKEIAHRELLEEQLRRVAERDSLTGLNSRRHFMKLADALLQVSREDQTPFSLFMIDVDHFKRINDTWGHSQGDWVLTRIAEICTQALRPTDVIGRFGGEEFVVALPDTDAEQAVIVAERLRRKVAALPLEEAMSELQLSVTIGIAVARGDEVSLQNVIARADRALYAGKREGRDQVVACAEIGAEKRAEDSLK